MQQSYLIKLLERIAYQTSGTQLEFENYLTQVVKRPKMVRRRQRNKRREDESQPLRQDG